MPQLGYFLKRISPEVGRKSPRMSEANVLFPEPLRPKIANFFVFQELLTISHLIPFFLLIFHMQKDKCSIDKLVPFG